MYIDTCDLFWHFLLNFPLPYQPRKILQKILEITESKLMNKIDLDLIYIYLFMIIFLVLMSQAVLEDKSVG